MSDDSDEGTYEVEAIIGHRVRDGKDQYLLRWKYYDDSEATWEFEEDMNCPELLQEYKAGVLSNEAPGHSKTVDPHMLKIQTIQERNPKMVIAGFRENGKLVYRVACAKKRFYNIEADLLRQVCPELICLFLENKIQPNN